MPERAALRALPMVAPAVALMLALQFGPLLLVLATAFTDWQIGSGVPNFVGLANFATLLHEAEFRRAALATLSYLAIAVPGTVLAGLGLALLIEGCTRGRGLYRTLFFLPYIATMAAMCVAWQLLLHPNIGLLNQLLGLGAHNWLRDDAAALPVLAIIGIWHESGFAMVFFLAALGRVPAELNEAARLDGMAAAWDRFWLVTFPHIRGMAGFVLVVVSAHSVMVFDTVALLTQGGPDGRTVMLLYLIYQEAFGFFRTNQAAAATVLFLVLTLALGVAQLRAAEAGR